MIYKCKLHILSCWVGDHADRLSGIGHKPAKLGDLCRRLSSLAFVFHVAPWVTAYNVPWITTYLHFKISKGTLSGLESKDCWIEFINSLLMVEVWYGITATALERLQKSRHKLGNRQLPNGGQPIGQPLVTHIEQANGQPIGNPYWAAHWET